MCTKICGLQIWLIQVFFVHFVLFVDNNKPSILESLKQDFHETGAANGPQPKVSGA